MRLLVSFFGIFLVAAEAAAQGTLIGIKIMNSPLAGYHVDEFYFRVGKEVKTLTASVDYGPLNQIHPGGNLSVFPTELSSTEMELDSHLTFDVSHGNILSATESAFGINAKVEFSSNYPTGEIPLAHAVATDGHAPYQASIIGTFVDGTAFAANIVFVPEPGFLTIACLGCAFFGIATRPGGARNPKKGRKHLPEDY